MDLPTFKNPKLLEQAFIHRSFLNETKDKLESNERLEFLGDSVISFVVSQYLYNSYPEYKEGVLTNIRALMVNTGSLAQVAKELEFGKRLQLSHGEEESKGRENESLLANCFEAFVGALYLDSGTEAVETFLKPVLLVKVEQIVTRKTFKDPKSLLQEKIQAQKQKSPLYKVMEEVGPPHARTFTVGVYIDDTLIGKGHGTSKQKAQEEAAKHALENELK